MTLISYSQNHGAPVLISDILITAQKDANRIGLPTQFDGARQLFSTSLHAPVQLLQKVYITHSNVCKVSEMYTFIKSVRAFFPKEAPTPDELEKFISSYDPEKLQDIFALITIAEVNGSKVNYEHFRLGSWVQSNTPSFGTVWTSGSGAKDFIARLDALEGAEMKPIVAEDHHTIALASNLSYLSSFLMHEIASGETLLNRWGAGYELTFFADDKFQKLDDFTFILCSGVIRGNGLDFGYRRIMKYKYHEDLLVIRANDFNGSDKNFTVLPIDKSFVNYSASPPKIPNYKSEIIIVLFLIQDEENAIHGYSYLKFGDAKDAGIMIDDDGVELKVGFSENFLKELMRRVEFDVKRD